MARARNIKPGFFENETLAELPFEARLLFIGLWTLADRLGRLECRPRKIKAQIFPYDSVNIEKLLEDLSTARFIQIYQVGEAVFIQVVNFVRHQNPHKNEKDCDIPEPNENNILNHYPVITGNSSSSTEKIGSAPADSLLRIPDSLIPDSGYLKPDSQEIDETVGKPPARIPKTESQQANLKTWNAYSTAYFNRYGAEPVRNAKINSQIAQLVQRLGAVDAPGVAEHYVRSNSSYYHQRGHSIDCLLADAEKLRTEWATGKTMTTTRARQIDQTEANRGVVDEALRILEGHA